MKARPAEPLKATPPTHRAQRGALNARQALILIALLFLAPVVTAWLVHKSVEHGGWTGHTTNQGTLIQPLRPLKLPAGLLDAKGAPVPETFLRGKWTLLYIGHGACAEACRKSIFTLRQVRLAQGENMRRVQRLYLAIDTPAAQLRQTQTDYPALAVALVPPPQAEALAPLFDLDGTPMQKAERVYLVDPLGNLMMYYRPGADPRGIIKDLERLLKYSHVG